MHKPFVLILALLSIFSITAHAEETTHFGILEEPPKVTEEVIAEPDYDCSFGCSHLENEPHNYKGFNIYGNAKTVHIKSRSSSKTVNLTDLGGAGSAPLKCLTQYKQDATHHWEGCINHPGTGTWNGQYHNAGRINLTNHSFILSESGSITCKQGESILPTKKCSATICGYKRGLVQSDFPLIHKGKQYVYTDLFCQANMSAPMTTSGENTHYKPCLRCSDWGNTISYTSYPDGKSWCTYTDGAIKVHCPNEDTGLCMNCGNKMLLHKRNSKWLKDYEKIPHGNGLVACTNCGMQQSKSPVHNGWSECFYCPLVFTVNNGLEATWLSGDPSKESSRYRFRTQCNNGFTNLKVTSAFLIPYYTENGATFPVTTQQAVITDHTITVAEAVAPRLTDTGHQNTLNLRMDVVYTGIAADGLAFYASSYPDIRTKPDRSPPYSASSIVQNGTPSSWKDTLVIKALAKDDWSKDLTFSIYDSDNNTQLGPSQNGGNKDINTGYFQTDFKVIAEATTSKTIYLRATDTCGNYTNFGFQVQYVDTYAPRIQSVTANNNVWSRSKAVRFNAIEAGSRETKMSFNDGVQFDVCSQSGDNYYIDYTFTGDVYTAQTRPYWFQDKLINTQQAMFTINKIDNTSPTISAISEGINSNYTEAILSVTANDVKVGLGEGSGVKTYAISKTNSLPISGWQASNVFRVKENGMYYLWAKDGVDLTSPAKSFLVSTIDDIKPSLSLTAPTSWTNQKVVISAKATDERSGIKNIKLPNGSTVNSITSTYDATTNGIYSFEVTDNAGNVEIQSITVDCIDKIVPTILLSASTDWTNKPFDIIIKTSDDLAGVAKIKLPDKTEPATSNSFKISSNGVYSFTVYDKAGNESTSTISISNFDYIIPTAVASNLPTDWLLRPHDITVTASDDYSGVKRLQTPDNVWHNTTEVKYPVFKNEDYLFHIEDNASNVYELRIPINQVENTDPVISVTGNAEEWVNHDVVLNVHAKDAQSGVRGISLGGNQWEPTDTVNYLFSENQDFQVMAEDNVGHRTTINASVNKIGKIDPIATYELSTTDWTNKDVTIKVLARDEQSGLKNFTGDMEFKMSANGSISLKISDLADNVITLPIVVANIDKDKPFIEGIGIAELSRGQVPLLITADDSTSSITKIEYQLISAGNSLYDGEWLTYEKDMKISAPFKGDVATRCYDSAGNISDVLSKPFMIDTIKPKTKARMSSSVITNEPVIISYQATDMESGFDYTVLPNNLITREAEIDYTAKENGTYKFKSFDYAGNETVTPVKVSNIDRNPPVATISQTPTIWTKGPVNLFMTVTDDSKVIKADPASQTAQVNGEYYFDVEDEHHNKTILTHVVSNIDQMNPSISGSAANYLATLYAEDFQSGVKVISTPLGMSYSSSVMFNVAANSSYPITCTDNAGNFISVTLYTDEKGNGSLDVKPSNDTSLPTSKPDQVKPDKGNDSNTAKDDDSGSSSHKTRVTLMIKLV